VEFLLTVVAIDWNVRIKEPRKLQRRNEMQLAHAAAVKKGIREIRRKNEKRRDMERDRER